MIVTTSVQLHASGLAIPVEKERTIPQWEAIAREFLASYRNANTRKNYAQGLRAWFQWCRNRGLEPLQSVRRHDIELWLREMEEVDGLALSTVVHRLNAISGYYKRAYVDGHIPGTPLVGVRRPRIERVSTSTYLTRVELGRVLEVAEKRNDMRDLAILCLLGLNGLRVSELVGINVEDVDRERGYRTILVHRKGDRTQKIPLAYRTTWAVDQVIAGRVSGPLFLSKRTPNKRISRGDVQRLVKRYARWAGIVKNIHPHSFRHSFVTLSLDAGSSTRDVQNSSGHADPRMVSYYDRNRESLSSNTTHTLAAFVDGAI